MCGEYRGFSGLWEVLNLSGSQLNWTVSGFGSSRRSVYLSLYMLHGAIPSEIVNNCQKLDFLDLSSNSLSRGILSSLGHCIPAVAGILQLPLLHSLMWEDAISAELSQLKKLKFWTFGETVSAD
ncbi:hypothetical protein Nepgr_029296 [Nepenthes gracilis]|uniref:Uncharacterized protein n=1 Tax=Nepenthes gracilis TaxID=150966 RepID=A0AAD3TC86_NEPGR|nr:hypothetical protein Nepgr_029296 [Nepenthes gracilis]